MAKRHKIIVKLQEDESNISGINYTIAEVEDLFVKDMKSRQLRPMTIKYYHFVVEYLYKFLPYNTPIREITQGTVQEFIAFLKSRVATGTVHTNLKGLRTFLYWAMKNNFMNSFKITVPNSERVPLDMYTVEEVQKLIKTPNMINCKFSELMSWTAINLLAFTGMRARTATSMKIGDIDFEGSTIVYRHTKNRKVHTVPLPSQLAIVLKKYIKIRTQGEEANNIPSLTLLCNCYGEDITPSNLYKYVQTYNRVKGVQRTGLHAFRRFYIKSLVVQGVPIPKIQHLVQHSNANLVSHYSKMYANDLVEDVEKFANFIKPSKESKKKIKV